MGIDFDELVRDALASKADHAAIARVAEIRFCREFRKACEQNACGKYDSNWACPPAVGSFTELKAKACQYKQGLLIQTVHRIRSSFDWKGMVAGGKVHGKVFREILDKVKNQHKLKDILPLNAGPCQFCRKCTYLENEPCKFPEEAFASVEAYGIDVINLEKACNIPYYNGKNTVSYVGLILFNTEGDRRSKGCPLEPERATIRNEKGR